MRTCQNSRYPASNGSAIPNGKTRRKGRSWMECVPRPASAMDDGYSVSRYSLLATALCILAKLPINIRIPMPQVYLGLITVVVVFFFVVFRPDNWNYTLMRVRSAVSFFFFFRSRAAANRFHGARHLANIVSFSAHWRARILWYWTWEETFVFFYFIFFY